jgi:putative pyruvate formate lyase activating enzyme
MNDSAPSTRPAYLALLETGDLRRRMEEAVSLLADCRLCPRNCGVNRLADETGFCRTGRLAAIASFGPHFGEEPPLVGSGGSGAIFFAECNLRCIFCQNADISLLGQGTRLEPHEIAAMMLDLERRGCHNINLVTPSHVMPQVLQALVLAAESGLALPLVWNSSAYETVQSLKLLDGIVDIYMPDFKFADSQWASEFCRAPDYPERAEAAVREMHRQVGDLQFDSLGVARRGLLVRHLVMPNHVAGTPRVARILADLSPRTFVNIMDQYRPCGAAVKDPVIGRRITADEYRQALRSAAESGLRMPGIGEDRQG